MGKGNGKWALGYLVDQSPGVLLGYGGGEHLEDLVQVQTVVRVQVARVPHPWSLLSLGGMLECWNASPLVQPMIQIKMASGGDAMCAHNYAAIMCLVWSSSTLLRSTDLTVP